MLDNYIKIQRLNKKGQSQKIYKFPNYFGAIVTSRKDSEQTLYDIDIIHWVKNKLNKFRPTDDTDLGSHEINVAQTKVEVNQILWRLLNLKANGKKRSPLTYFIIGFVLASGLVRLINKDPNGLVQMMVGVIYYQVNELI